MALRGTAHFATPCLWNTNPTVYSGVENQTQARRPLKGTLPLHQSVVHPDNSLLIQYIVVRCDTFRQILNVIKENNNLKKNNELPNNVICKCNVSQPLLVWTCQRVERLLRNSLEWSEKKNIYIYIDNNNMRSSISQCFDLCFILTRN